MRSFFVSKMIRGALLGIVLLSACKDDETPKSDAAAQGLGPSVDAAGAMMGAGGAIAATCTTESPALKCRTKPDDCQPSTCNCASGLWVCTRDCAGGRICSDGGTSMTGCGGKACAADEFCETPSCGDTSKGVCTKKTSFCTLIYAPVCGCDGKTYGNDCGRQGVGVGKKATGECGGDAGAPR